MDNCLEVKNVSFAYGARQVLKNISFTVEKGEILGILGPNGAGKTTLLKCVLRKERIREGEITLWGKKIISYEQNEIARLVSYVPQEIFIPFSFTVFEVIMMGRYPHHSPTSFETSEEAEMAKAVLRETDTWDLSNRFFNELSGGEKQRALLARALAQQAPLMLLDEPNSNLDIRHISQLLNLLRKSRKDRNATLVFVTHDLNLASCLADRLILIKEGSLHAIGKSRDILTPSSIRALYDVEINMIEDPETGAPIFTYPLDIAR
ncbi:ABC transporter ATP-binding protein [Candidatus Sumerlaeota bacterium]|nr:ABC transporter ATP-binding protein [Candidatus Sumerlaeota bacterium]